MASGGVVVEILHHCRQLVEENNEHWNRIMKLYAVMYTIRIENVLLQFNELLKGFGVRYEEWYKHFEQLLQKMQSALQKPK